MGPTSMALMVILGVLAVVAPVAVVLMWLFGADLPRRRWWSIPLVLLVLLGELGTVGVVAISANREYGFYTQWDQIFDESGGESKEAAPDPGKLPGFSDSTAKPGPSATGGASGAPGAIAQGEKDGKQVLLEGTPTPGTHGRTFSTTFTGPKSGLTGSMHVWLPPQYDDPKYKDHVFPVVIAYPGIGASDEFYWGPNGLDAENKLGAAVKAGSIAPFVVVMPSQRFMPRYKDPECMDAPHGAKALTWARDDVPTWIKSEYRVSSQPRYWSAYGFSLGGYCGVKIQLTHPEILGSAINFGGNVNIYEVGADAAVISAVATTGRAPLLDDLKKADPTQVRVLIAQAAGNGGYDVGFMEKFKKDADAMGKGDGVQVMNMGEIGHELSIWGKNSEKFYQWITRLMRG